MLRQINFFLNEMPFVFWSAAVFYTIALSVCIMPGPRRRFVTVFTPPGPAAHSLLAPLDSLRGFAALWVFCFHIYFFMRPINDGLERFGFARHGPMAVSFFAVLSGFLVYRSIQHRAVDGNTIKEYARRRFLRIYPLYIITMLLGIATLKMSVGNYGDLGARGYLADVFMLRVFGYPNYFGMPRWNPPMWSLYCEVMFYCLLPLFVSVARRRVLPVSIAGFILTSIIGSGELEIGFILLLKYFFAGIIICELYDVGALDRIWRPAAPLLFAAGIALLYYSCIDRPLVDQFLNCLYEKALRGPGPYTNSSFSISVAISAALIIIGALKCGPISWVFSLFPFRFIGIVSYSIYLLQTIVIRYALKDIPIDNMPEVGNLTTFILIFVPMILLYASISYAVIERVFLGMKNTGLRNPS